MPTPDDLRHTLGLVHSQIAAADHKATALLTIAGVLIAFPAPSILVPESPGEVPFLAALLAAGAAFAFLVSLFAALYVLFPRTKNTTNTHSLIFFGNIAALKHHEYADAVKECRRGARS